MPGADTPCKRLLHLYQLHLPGYLELGKDMLHVPADRTFLASERAIRADVEIFTLWCEARGWTALARIRRDFLKQHQGTAVAEWRQLAAWASLMEDSIDSIQLV